ncbi:hypothetical protein Shyd_70340 [Streptomyces hydrogenans]|uniref:Uncharacterized protein n=1 Tax=Streptomyces hydrogenans TaxID=1873719 RepID=A0ABQ3PKV8_9ACTN|nr:hypothetical protein GCM10018784_37150 [Streptomyces hydrogenans]GHI23121.1 hypothetical protein Shyd_44920 [Streptomyces hydrogenans]GHI25649.1 hypothetical protein Shyd_70200 [Streptomyces hydrogenans]GHI25663.1 hypothetical protein Shyd_70340 [Streptomyces hydrogenans]
MVLRTTWHGCGTVLAGLSVPLDSVYLRAVGFRGVQLCSAAASLALSGGGPVQARDPTDGQAPPMAKSALPALAARKRSWSVRTRQRLRRARASEASAQVSGLRAAGQVSLVHE